MKHIAYIMGAVQMTTRPFPSSTNPTGYRTRLRIGDGKSYQFYGKTAQEAELKAEKFLDFEDVDPLFYIIPDSFELLHPALKQIYAASIGNAKVRGIEHSLTKAQFIDLCRSTRGRCMFSRIPFSLTKGIKKKRRPFVPSLDRIDSSLGYTVTNCRLVCALLNFAFNAWGQQPFLELARYMVAEERKREDARGRR